MKTREMSFAKQLLADAKNIELPKQINTNGLRKKTLKVKLQQVNRKHGGIYGFSWIDDDLYLYRRRN